MTTYRIHGDNIVECERIANLIFNEVTPTSHKCFLVSPSTITYQMTFIFLSNEYDWNLELPPGFNKSGRSRWEKDIFSSLRKNGSFLDETPDAIITKVEGNNETILCAIEFCSALQAGNQAWQRSGRAYSTGRTGCPYLYIVDFVKYELDSKTRERKNLRFPNAAVPYSYINFTKDTGNFVAQVYVKSEEFDKTSDDSLRNFSEDDFALKEMSSYIVKLMAGLDTSAEEEVIIKKNLNVVLFLSESVREATNFTKEQWRRLYAYHKGIVAFSIENARFNFHKTITAKGHHGKSEKVVSLIDDYSVGLASRDLPFGIIPANNRRQFSRGMKKLYPDFADKHFDALASADKDLILCLIKGFKPRGDDNRPDRGLLPFATMLSSHDADVMTYLYGPVNFNNYQLLQSDPQRLASTNGLWKSILALSDFVMLDVPILRGSIKDAELFLDTTKLKEHYTESTSASRALVSPAFSNIPLNYHEDDVDTGIHYIFSHLMGNLCFEGMCNPPGGDWSGFSIIDGNKEYRWLSLPRVSDEVDGKRPDHILEIYGVFEKPLLLSIESKERAMDLEPDVGTRLINYIMSLMDFVPNVERDKSLQNPEWKKSYSRVDFSHFESISAAAYLRSAAQPNDIIFGNSNCDMLFIMNPLIRGWDVEIVTQTHNAEILKTYIMNKIDSDEIKIH